MFLQRRHTDGQQAHEKMLNITNREIQIKTAMRYHLTPIRMAIIKNLNNTRWKKKLSYTVSGNVNWCNHYGEQ